MAKTDLPILEQRRIEANIIKPIFEEMKEQLGGDQAAEILGKAIIKDSIAQGKAYAASQDGPTNLMSFHHLLHQWKADGALELDMLSEEETQVDYNVTRCKYAEMYRSLGLEEIGHLLSCNRDGTFCTGYNPNIRLERTQTIMGGASHCDFRYSWVGDE
ncbi:MAG: L-2-amino-thiazoline-4-carboxylic acid hydrolase [Pseudomonadota bacterium]